MAPRIRLNASCSPTEYSADPRLSNSGFEKCMQCGRCTASCPAAYAFNDYLPRVVMSRLSLGTADTLAEAVWRCGQCYSCRARCPRNNSVGEAVLALREKFARQGNLPDSIRKVSCLLLKNLYARGETFLPQMMTADLLREFGPETYRRCSGNIGRRARLGYDREDARACSIPAGAMDEIRHILKATGCGDNDGQE